MAISGLIALRNAYPEARAGKIRWHIREDKPRLVCYSRYLEDEGRMLTVVLNATEESQKMGSKGKLLYGRKLRGRTLMPGGAAVYLEDA